MGHLRRRGRVLLARPGNNLENTATAVVYTPPPHRHSQKGLWADPYVQGLGPASVAVPKPPAPNPYHPPLMHCPEDSQAPPSPQARAPPAPPPLATSQA